MSDHYAPLELTPQKRKEKTLTALVTHLDGLSRRQPVLMVYLAAGQASAALDTTDEALSWSGKNGEHSYDSYVHSCRGDILRALGQPDMASNEYRAAIEVARQQEVSMARLWRGQGKRDEARDLLAPVYGWFTEGFDTLDLKEAKILLDELSSRVSATKEIFDLAGSAKWWGRRRANIRVNARPAFLPLTRIWIGLQSAPPPGKEGA